MLYPRHLILIALLLTSQLGLGQKIKQVKTPFEHGTLRAGKRTGLWEFFDAKGVVELRINYDSARIVYLQPDTARYLLRIDEQWQLVRPSRAPHPLGSRAGRVAELERNMHFPYQHLSKPLTGVVLISYIVEPDGHTSGHTLEQSLGMKYNDEVWRVLRDLPEMWIPALYQGHPTAAKFYLAVHFDTAYAGSAHQAREEEARLELQHAAMPPTLPYTDRIFMSLLMANRR
jgi:hypothetical protein